MRHGGHLANYSVFFTVYSGWEKAQKSMVIQVYKALLKNMYTYAFLPPVSLLILFISFFADVFPKLWSKRFVHKIEISIDSHACNFAIDFVWKDEQIRRSVHVYKLLLPLQKELFTLAPP